MGTESDNQSDYEVDSSVIFRRIPEETLNATPDPGSEFGSGSSQLGDNDGFLASDEDFPPYGSSYRPSGGSGGGDLPDIIIQLQKQLLKDYTLPPCPDHPPWQHTLSRAETLSLQHYLAWIGSNGTVKAYNAHAQVLGGATEEEILSLYRVRKLAEDLTGLHPSFIDMCPKSCMAYTGDSHSQSTCSYKDCNELRYKPQQSSTAKPKPRATMLYMPITPIIQAYYANAETSHEMRHRDECLKSTLDLLASGAGVKKSEFANSDNHISHYKKLGLFDDGRDTALSISTDGAQLTMNVALGPS
jgi:hypothetical protein